MSCHNASTKKVTYFACIDRSEDPPTRIKASCPMCAECCVFQPRRYFLLSLKRKHARSNCVAAEHETARAQGWERVPGWTRQGPTYPREDLYQGASEWGVALGVEKWHGSARVPTAARSTNAVHVLVDAGREVEVDHVLDVLNVQTPRGDRSGHQHRTLPGAEVSQGLFPLPLLPVAVTKTWPAE